MNPTFRIPSEFHLRGVFEEAKKLIRIRLMDGPIYLEVKRETRSLEQNRKLWPMLHDVAEQVPWAGFDLTETEYKNLFTGSMEEMKAVPAIDRPGVVMLGKATSTMNKKKFSELIEFMYAFGVEHDVVWSEKSKETYENRND